MAIEFGPVMLPEMAEALGHVYNPPQDSGVPARGAFELGCTVTGEPDLLRQPNVTSTVADRNLLTKYL